MRNGFTLIEITFFIAISGFLLGGVLAMTQTSIYQQRFSDATQSFAEFLRGVYSEAMNPQSIGDGRSENAIYGKMITFGETYGLMGEELLVDEQRVFVYDIVGDVSGGGTGDAKATLKSIGANVVVVKNWPSGAFKSAELAGIVEEYIPKWGAVIDGKENGVPFSGTILIVRRPQSGVVSTLVSNEAVGYVGSGALGGGGVNYLMISPEAVVDNIKSLLSSDVIDSFKYEQIDFCVNMGGYGKKSEKRRDVRIVEDARNTSGIELIDLDSEENECDS